MMQNTTQQFKMVLFIPNEVKVYEVLDDSVLVDSTIQI